jgi:Tol biopolymer transport system component
MAVATVTDTAADVWIYDLAGASSIRQLTFGGRNRYPVWSGNEFVVFQSDREGDAAIFWQRADGATPAERLTKAAQGEIHVPEAMSPDGKTLLYDFIGKDGQHALWSFSLLDRKTTKFGDLQNVSAIGAVFSPDGKWLAYKVNRPGGGAGQIFVQPFPQTGARYLVGDGVHPLWSRDGKELSYDNQGQRVTVVVTTQPTFTFSNPTSALRSTLSVTAQERDRDSLPDGRSVALLNPQNQFSASDRLQIQFVLNWFEELKARVPVQ